MMSTPTIVSLKIEALNLVMKGQYADGISVSNFPLYCLLEDSYRSFYYSSCTIE